MGDSPGLGAFLNLFTPEFADRVTTELAVSVPAVFRQVGQTPVSDGLEEFYLALLHSLLLQLSLLPSPLAVAFSALLFYATASNLHGDGGGESDSTDWCVSQTAVQ